MSEMNENDNNNVESIIVENHIITENASEVADVARSSMVVSKRPRKLKSPHWEHFEIKTFDDGTRRAICKHCNASLVCRANDGTSHIGRHVKNCVKLLWKTKSQKTLSFVPNLSGGVSLQNWKFDQNVSRTELARWLILHELPFRAVEHEGFRRFIRSVNPEFMLMTRNTIKSDCEKIYAKEKNILKETLKACERVILTTDLWTSNQNLGYMCLTVHYIDNGWKLHKKILKFSMVKSPHTGVAIGNLIIKALTEWDIDKKVSSITCDNCTVNDVLCKVLKANLLEIKALLLEGRFFHNRCCAHILNIIVKYGLEELHDAIKSIRDSVKYVKSSPSREQKFDEVVNQVGLSRKRSLSLDVSTRWNSTFLMLDSAIYYKRAFLVLETWDSDYILTPTLEDRKQSEFICKFLKTFYNATNILSATQIPTSNMCLHEICTIRTLLHQEIGSSNFIICDMVFQMQKKFDDYWGDCTLLYAITTVLDPRFKIMFLQYAFKQIYGLEGAMYVDDVSRAIYIIFDEYKEQSSQSDANQVLQENIEDDLHGDDDVIVENDFLYGYNQFLSQQILQDSKTELDRYLDESVAPLNQKKFDILKWWSDNALVYPILSKMARDYLAIPASTVASEAAFSTGGRVLDQYRSRLTPATVEALVCCQDWIKYDYKEAPADSPLP